MKALLVAAILSCACNFVQAVEVTVTGYGGSSDEALQNAKVLAIEYAASTFVTGKREITDGKYKETLGQYNGGLVQKYVVKSTAINDGVYAVTILADVNTDKINDIITNGDTATNTVVPQIEKAFDEIHKVQAAWVAISAASDPFVFAVDDVKYKIDGEYVQSEYHLHMKWNPKWLDDARQLAKAVNHPIGENTKEAICWYQKKQGNNICSDIVVLPMQQLYIRVTFNVTLHFLDGTTELLKYDKAYAPATRNLYDYNKWFHISPSDETESCGSGLVPGLFKIFVKLMDDKCFSNYVVESVIFYPDNVSLFNFTYMTHADKFKTIASVTFAPEW